MVAERRCWKAGPGGRNESLSIRIGGGKKERKKVTKGGSWLRKGWRTKAALDSSSWWGP